MLRVELIGEEMNFEYEGSPKDVINELAIATREIIREISNGTGWAESKVNATFYRMYLSARPAPMGDMPS